MSRRIHTSPPSAPQTMAQLAILATTAPFVMASRMIQMSLSGFAPSQGLRAEEQRMVVEKIAAGSEAMMKMQMAMMTAGMDQTLALMTGRRPAANTADRIAAAGLRPYTRRVRANRKRLLK